MELGRKQCQPAGRMVTLDELSPEVATMLAAVDGDVEQLSLPQLFTLEADLRRMTV
jgi:hypothetical protein